MSVYAELPDGRKLEFPDGTTAEVMAGTVKKVLGAGSTLPPDNGAPKPPPAVEQPEKGLLQQVAEFHDPRQLADPEKLAAHPVTRFALGAASPFIGLFQLGAHALGGGEGVDAHLRQLESMKKEGAADSPVLEAAGGAAELTGGVMSPAWLKAAKLVKPGQRLLTRTGQGAAFGAAGGLTAPVTDGDDYGDKKLEQTAGGAAIGAVIPGAVDLGSKVSRGVYHAFVEPVLRPSAIKGRAYLEASGDKADDVISNLLANRKLVPGSQPNAGEAAAPAGRAEFSALQESARKAAPSAYFERDQANNAARTDAIRQFAGTPAKRAEAVAERTARTAPHYEAGVGVQPKNESPLFIFKDGRVESGKGMDAHGNLLQDLGIDNDPEMVAKTGRFYVSSDKDSIKIIAGKDLYSKADALEAAQNYVARERPSKPVTLHFDEQTIPVHVPSRGTTAATSGLQELMERPSARAVLTRAERLAQEKSKDFQPLFPNGLPRSMTGEEAQTVKLAFDDMIKALPKSSMDSAELNAIQSTRSDYIKWMEKSFPNLGTGRKLYKMASQPINQMDVGEELLHKLTPALREEGGNLRSTAFANAVRESAGVVKKATGEPRFSSIEDVLSRRQLDSVHGVVDDLARSDLHKDLARRGADAAPSALDLATQNLYKTVGGKPPGLLDKWAVLTNAIVRRFEGKVDRKLAQEMAREMLDPREVAAALQEAQRNAARARAVTQLVNSGQRPAIAGAAGAVTNQGE